MYGLFFTIAYNPITHCSIYLFCHYIKHCTFMTLIKAFLFSKRSDAQLHFTCVSEGVRKYLADFFHVWSPKGRGVHSKLLLFFLNCWDCKSWCRLELRKVFTSYIRVRRFYSFLYFFFVLIMESVLVFTECHVKGEMSWGKEYYVLFSKWYLYRYKTILSELSYRIGGKTVDPQLFQNSVLENTASYWSSWRAID